MVRFNVQKVSQGWSHFGGAYFLLLRHFSMQQIILVLYLQFEVRNAMYEKFDSWLACCGLYQRI